MLGLIAGHFTTDPKFTNQFSGVSLYKKDLRDMPEKPVVYPVYLRHKGDNQRGGLFAYYEAQGDYVLQSVVDAVETPPKQQPNLREDLVNYYSMELGEIDRLYDILNPNNIPFEANLRAMTTVVNGAANGYLEKTTMRLLGGPLRLSLFRGTRGEEKAALYMLEKATLPHPKPPQIR